MLTEIQLLRLMLIEFGIAEIKGDKLALRERLNQFLLDQASQGNDAVLIIDEAQNLSRDMLEHIRLLSNLETESQKLLQIVLVGQPELRAKLNDHRLRQLRQRIAVHFHLEGMSRDDTTSYVNHRLTVAGGNGEPRFETEAIDLLFESAEGIPRQVNALSDMALLAAYGRGEHAIKLEAMQAAVKEMKGICQ
jgi:general secretion pathway protein A